METKYVVFIGPNYPPAVKVRPGVDFCLVLQRDCKMEVLATRSVPSRYQDGWRTRLRNRCKKELEDLAKELNGHMDDVARAALLFDLRSKQKGIEEGLRTSTPEKALRHSMGTSSAQGGDVARRGWGSGGPGVDPIW